jgi:hypothetical protein
MSFSYVCHSMLRSKLSTSHCNPSGGQSFFGCLVLAQCSQCIPKTHNTRKGTPVHLYMCRCSDNVTPESYLHLECCHNCILAVLLADVVVLSRPSVRGCRHTYSYRRAQSLQACPCKRCMPAGIRSTVLKGKLPCTVPCTALEQRAVCI